jgi:hypothetical protein
MMNETSPAPVIAMRNFLSSDDVKSRSSMFMGCYGVDGSGSRIPEEFSGAPRPFGLALAVC